MFLQRLQWFSSFPFARTHPWFQTALAHLQTFQNAPGWYRFPASYLPEKPAGYWVTAAYCAFEPGRRAAEAMEVESTARMIEWLV
jgi:hypothetical protein